MKIGQQIETKIGNGVVTEISKKYVIVLIDGISKKFDKNILLNVKEKMMSVNDWANLIFVGQDKFNENTKWSLVTSRINKIDSKFYDLADRFFNQKLTIEDAKILANNIEL